MFGFDVAGGTVFGTARHLDVFGLPIDLWIMVAEPVVP
jgi:hypothetical protein